MIVALLLAKLLGLLADFFLWAGERCTDGAIRVKRLGYRTFRRMR